MDALQNRGRDKSLANRRKKNYKDKYNLSDGDTTPSDFDADDSEWDSSDKSD